jgi:murein DD-endopeptidase MepM/ murein hydrolase activator NlpD
MMQFMHSHRSGRSLALAPRGAAILFTVFAGGCSAEISRFDFPGFSLTDDKKDQTASLQQPSGSDRGPNYLGNEGQNTSSGYGNGYNAPRSDRDGGVAVAELPATSQPAQNWNYVDERRRRAGLEPSRPPSPPPARPGESVEVRPGDTLYGLSRQHHVSVAQLMEVNQLNNPNLHPGQRIYLPEGYSAQPRPMQTASVRPPVSVPAAAAGKYRGSYTMRSGDSLYGISRSYGVTVAELQRANGITDPRSVRAGSVLKVPGSAGFGSTGRSTAVAAAAPVTEHRTQVADAAPIVVQTTHVPTVINRSDTQLAGLGADVSTGAIDRTPPRAQSSEKLRWPVHGKILSGFGERNDGTHNDGINLSVPQGTAVHAAESGTVAYAGSELKGYGNLILVRHDNGWVTAYAHNEQLMVKRGDKVQRGQVIAKAGRTGAVDQPQLHFELRQGSKPVDPVPFLERL